MIKTLAETARCAMHQSLADCGERGFKGRDLWMKSTAGVLILFLLYMSPVSATDKYPRWILSHGDSAVAEIGEPVFEVVVEELGRSGLNTAPVTAAWVIKRWIKQEDGFLHTNLEKRIIAREALIKATTAEDWWIRHNVVQALQYFSDPKISDLLWQLHKNDDALKDSAKKAYDYYRRYSQPLSTFSPTTAPGFRIDPKDFNAEEFEFVVNQIRKMLREFRELTEILARHSNAENIRQLGLLSEPTLNDTLIIKIPANSFSKFTTLGWSSQNHGFHNFPLRLEGYGLVSNEKILRLQIENMKLRDSPEDTIQQMQRRWRKAKRELDFFLATESYSD